MCVHCVCALCVCIVCTAVYKVHCDCVALCVHCMVNGVCLCLMRVHWLCMCAVLVCVVCVCVSCVLSVCTQFVLASPFTRSRWTARRPLTIIRLGKW